jgi:hypothetical protein
MTKPVNPSSAWCAGCFAFAVRGTTCVVACEIALHRPFVEALADDKFAAAAHTMLANLE